jgi:hypothetical protein
MAVFVFADAHRINVCDPPTRKITGTLTTFAAGAYSVVFSADGRTIGTWTGQCAAGNNVVDCAHTAVSPGPQPFQKNVSVSVNGAAGGLPVPICLRS